MTLSEFWDAVDEVFGATLGRSLTADLYLPALRATCVEALEQGISPDEVWGSLCVRVAATRLCAGCIE